MISDISAGQDVTFNPVQNHYYQGKLLEPLHVQHFNGIRIFKRIILIRPRSSNKLIVTILQFLEEIKNFSF
jgi:hypothetical protein